MDKRKLTKEELLAGKCIPDDDQSSDARFKSPDEILLQMVSARRISGSSEVTIQHGHLHGETKLGPNSTVQHEPANDAIKKSFNELSERYENDKRRWKEYEQSIHQWKAQVMDIVQNLQHNVADVETLKKEMEILKEMNRKKDEEIHTLAAKLRITDPHSK